MINLFQPTLGDDELAAIREVFESAWLGRGKRTEEFERRFAEHLGVDAGHVRSIPSCTDGLFLSMELLEIGVGDEVILPTVNFVGAGNAVAASGATPVFCDVDSRTLNPRLEQIEAVVTERTRAILLIHYGGLPADIEAICAFARQRGIAVIEDSACSISSTVGGQRCGTFGDIAVWSFDAMKILVTADGGMLYVRDPELAARAETLTYLGLETKSGFSQAASASRWWEFEISSFSRRSIINDVTAAMGLVQLDRLPGFIERRREVHERYTRELADLDWLELPPAVPDGRESSYYFYWLQLEASARDALAQQLLDKGIYSTFRYYPLHLVEGYGSRTSLPEAEAAAHRTLCIPMHHGLTDEEVAAVISGIRSFDRVGVTT
jgi:aminotransferase